MGLVTPGSAFDAITNPALGAFVYRSTTGAGNNIFNSIALRWNYGSNSVRDDALVNVQVFAIEMVRVTQSAFFLGSGGLEGGSFTRGDGTVGNVIPFQITSEDAITIGTSSSSNLWGTSTSGTSTIGAAGTLSADFPKGFRTFYCMKYELSQGQYRDFLNTLTRRQQNNLTATSLGLGITDVTNRYVMTNQSTITGRNGIRCDATIDMFNPINFYCDFDGDGTPNESNDGEWIACNFLLWMDAAAFSDWAGLRPMTELEFEKACRGPLSASVEEFPWGNIQYELTLQLALDNIGTQNEGISEGYVTTTSRGNMLHDLNRNSSSGTKRIDGPIRVGIFAANALNDGTRLRTGATYYGIMEMGGNLFEQVVTLGNAAGRSFTGLHGNGGLTSSGDADVDFWPGINGNSNRSSSNNIFSGLTGVTAAAGSGRKGSSWYRNPSAGKVSVRREVNVPVDSRTLADNGFRAVRTAPPQ